LPAYIAGDLKTVAQNPEQITYSKNIHPQQKELDWNNTARQLINHIRGMNPRHDAHTYIQG
ncbi:methionyl-tRNA formyltransferase, partial [Streptococcus suis]